MSQLHTSSSKLLLFDFILCSGLENLKVWGVDKHLKSAFYSLKLRDFILDFTCLLVIFRLKLGKLEETTRRSKPSKNTAKKS